MPLLHEIRAQQNRANADGVRRLKSIGGTLKMRRRVDAALRLIGDWVSRCRTPIVSVSGGKDSTALLALCRRVVPDIPVIRADMPVPLSDRADHCERLQRAAGGKWIVVPYSYDVEGVLAGDVPYPYGMKQRELYAAERAIGADGVALGIRCAESLNRLRNRRFHGLLYRTLAGRWHCTPIADWSAEEVVAFVLYDNTLPLNPVYEKTQLLPELEHLRDGTWMPNQVSDALGYRDWIVYHYPEHVEDYDRARVALGGGRLR